MSVSAITQPHAAATEHAQAQHPRKRRAVDRRRIRRKLPQARVEPKRRNRLKRQPPHRITPARNRAGKTMVARAGTSICTRRFRA
jgi:hypothetical protein